MQTISLSDDVISCIQNSYHAPATFDQIPWLFKHHELRICSINKWWQHFNSALTSMTCFPYLGGELARLREARGLTPQNLAQLIGVRDVTILNLEAGKFFKADLLEQILTSLGCHLAIAPDDVDRTLVCAESAASYSCGAVLPGMEFWLDKALQMKRNAEKTARALATASSSKPTCIEICAGAGGQALGLEMAGFEHVALVEYESDYCDALKKNRPEWNVICGDVKNFSGEPFKGRIDLLAGGVPCPPFSKAGKQLGSEDERDLFPEAIRLVREIRPRAVMLENVRGFLDPVFKEYRAGILKSISDLGYKVEIKLLHASDYGVPQLRPRVVIVGIRNDVQGKFHYPAQVPGESPTVASTLIDLMKKNGWRGADAWARGADKIAPTVVGGSKKHGGPDLGPARARSAWAELGIDGMGVANDSPAADFTGQPRLTPRMIARIQGFPDTWQFANGKTKACRMIGNAFPPPVAKAVGVQILNALEAK